MGGGTTGGFAVGPDGGRVAYRVRGDGPPVLFVAGAGMPGGGWRPQVAWLAGEHRCVWFDHRGLGRSDPPGPGRMTVPGLAAAARAVLDAADVDAAHVIGHGLGGPVALELTLAAPDRVRSLALLGTAACGRTVGRPSPWVRWLGTRRTRRAEFLNLHLAPGDREAAAARLARAYGRDLADRPSAAAAQAAAWRDHDATARLGELAWLPTLVLAGERDRVAPPALGRAVAAGIPGAEFVLVPGAGHAFPLTHAVEVNTGLLAHLRRADRVPEGLACA
jgi:pimeloyl-ACP methyl ester carboxylesterase